MEKEKLREGFYEETINDETLTKANALLVIKCASLEQQVKKQKEVIDKAIEWVEKNRYYFPTPDELLDILKEVSE